MEQYFFFRVESSSMEGWIPGFKSWSRHNFSSFSHINKAKRSLFMQVIFNSWKFYVRPREAGIYQMTLLRFATVSTLLSVNIFIGCPFPHPTFMGARGAPKRNQRYNYSYHRAQNSYQLFWKPWFNIILLLFLYITPANPRPYHC